MSSSLSEQLLKAGLITEEKIEQAELDKQKQRQRKKAQYNAKQKQSKKATHTSPAPTKPKKAKPNNNDDDLAKFYQQRKSAEQREQALSEAKRKEEARLRKERKTKTRTLISKHRIPCEDAEIRYNFMVGKTIKYTYVTQALLDQLIKGELAITYYANTHTLIPKAIGEEVLAIDPSKMVYIPEPDTDQEQ